MYKTAWIVFFIGFVWDLLLRFSYAGVFGSYIQALYFTQSFKCYFEKHTILSSSLIAGFVSSLAYIVIQWLTSITKYSSYAILLVVSAGFGYIMRLSGLFPYLSLTYYKKMGRVSIFTDALSGIVVGVTYKVLNFIF